MSFDQMKILSSPELGVCLEPTSEIFNPFTSKDSDVDERKNLIKQQKYLLIHIDSS